MSDLLSIGASGLKAYSSALSTVSDNIANSQTEGYARRNVRLAEGPNGGDNFLYRTSSHPSGVLATGIQRTVDSWLVADAQTATSDAERASSRLNWLQATERALDDGQGVISARTTAIFNSADQLTADPTNTTLRAQFLGRIDEAASSFRQSAVSLQSVSQGVAESANSEIAQTNTDLTALARVNDGLRRAREGSTNQASLLDERDKLINQISGAISITTEFDAHGAATVRVAGSGDPLVMGSTVSQISLTVAADGRLGFGLTPGPGSVTAVSGRLAGLSDAANHVANQRASLDTIANQFVADFNSAHQAGRDSAGNPGLPLLSGGGGALTVFAVALTPANVAAADNSSNNGNMLAFDGLRVTGGVEAKLASMIAQQSQATASAHSQSAAATSRRDGAFEARDSVSAVDLDHEAAELLRYQQAYEGAARVIQVARENLQVIMSVF
jgi:flagellar hook-associated protein 1